MSDRKATLKKTGFHYVGNGVCAYFEGFSAYRAGAGVYTVLIGT